MLILQGRLHIIGYFALGKLTRAMNGRHNE
jgi:hypothetical protein